MKAKQWLLLAVMAFSGIFISSVSSAEGQLPVNWGNPESIEIDFPGHPPDLPLEVLKQPYDVYEFSDISQEEAEILLSSAVAALYLVDGGQLIIAANDGLETARMAALRFMKSPDTAHAFSELTLTVQPVRKESLKDFLANVKQSSSRAESSSTLYLSKIPSAGKGGTTPSSFISATEESPNLSESVIISEGFESGLEKWKVESGTSDGDNGQYDWGITACSAHKGSHSVDGVRGGTNGTGLDCSSVLPASQSNLLTYYQYLNLSQGSEAWLDYYCSHDNAGSGNTYCGAYFYDPSTDDWGGWVWTGSYTNWWHKIYNLRQWLWLGDLKTKASCEFYFYFKSDSSGISGWGARIDDVTISTDAYTGLRCSIDSASPTSGPAPLTVYFSASTANESGSVSYKWHPYSGSDWYSGGKTYNYTYNIPGNYDCSFYVSDQTGTCYSSSTVTVTAHGPVITSVSKATNPFRLKIAGNDFVRDCTIKIDGVAVPRTKFKSSTLLVAKNCGAQVPKGTTVKITVVNPDGGVSNEYPYNRSGGACNCSISPTNVNVPSSVFSGSFSVTTSGGCSWTASSDSSWLHTSSSGTGNGTVSYSIDVNTGSVSRTGHITINPGGVVFTAIEGGASCYPTFSPGSMIVSASAGGYSFEVTDIPADCAWSANSDEYWIHPGGGGPGPGTVYYDVDENTSTGQRVGQITASGRDFMVSQSGAVTVSVSPDEVSLGKIGGCPGGSSAATFNVTAPSNVTWTADIWNGTSYSSLSGGSGAGTGSFEIIITCPPDSPTPGFTCSDVAEFQFGEFCTVNFSYPDHTTSSWNVVVYWTHLLVL